MNRSFRKSRLLNILRFFNDKPTELDKIPVAQSIPLLDALRLYEKTELDEYKYQSTQLLNEIFTEESFNKFVNRISRFKSDKKINPRHVKLEPSTKALIEKIHSLTNEFETDDDVIFEALNDLIEKLY
ncbi:hypothetical protein [Algibacillus agarilyticus]|uniref:hypothetical protein n=1 Tax=Algibacillus agarilyticus TaxID=2234133 RepID=UPI000DD0ABA7|nr:hypothetical protein [Algibacillus agarilyticus]